MSEDTLLYEKDGAVTRLVLNRPEKHNALTFAMFDRLVEMLHEAEDDDDTKVIILKGNGPSFCSGHDLSEVGFVYGFGEGETEEGRRRRPSQRVRLQFDRKLLEKYMAFQYSMKPIIAQVQGHCIGAGFFLTELVDLAICADTASFSHAEQRLMGGGRSLILNAQMLAYGPKRARELLLLGRTLDGKQAVDLGVVNRSVPEDELEATVEDWAEQICRHPKDGLVIGKAFNQLALESFGYTAQIWRGYIGHTLNTNIRFEDDEYNFFRERRERGVGDAAHGRDEFFSEDDTGGREESQ